MSRCSTLRGSVSECILCEPECVVARSRCSTLRGSFSVCILYVSLSELLPGVDPPCSEVPLVYAYYV